jgi:hypothetical protein
MRRLERLNEETKIDWETRQGHSRWLMINNRQRNRNKQSWINERPGAGEKYPKEKHDPVICTWYQKRSKANKNQ